MTRQLRILAIDDDATDGVVLQRHLARITAWEVEVRLCTDPEEALEALEESAYDVALLDYYLGATTGLELMQRIHGAGHDLPVVFLTGSGDEELVVELLQAGAQDYIPKAALSANALQRSISNTLDKADLRRALAEHREHLERTNEDLSRRNREIESFYHSVSHELRTPLTSIREFVSVLAEGLVGTVTEEQREILEMARQSTFQMQRCIDDLFDATRLETGKLSVSPAPGSLADVLRHVATGMKGAAAEAGVTLTKEIADGLPLADIDDARVTQVVSNLVSNALKFTPAGGQVRVCLELDDGEPDWLRVSVADTGRGIAADQLERIFERLYQVREDDYSTGGGLGLGLSICRELVELHGGRIWVESQEARGSTFHFTVPAHRSESVIPTH